MHGIRCCLLDVCEVRQREILGACLEQHPTYLIGHEVHKWIPEWDAVARARVIDYDTDDKLSWDGILANCGAARGEDSLLQSPAECGRMHAPVDSETDLTLAV